MPMRSNPIRSDPDEKTNEKTNEQKKPTPQSASHPHSHSHSPASYSPPPSTYLEIHPHPFPLGDLPPITSLFQPWVSLERRTGEVEAAGVDLE